MITIIRCPGTKRWYIAESHNGMFRGEGSTRAIAVKRYDADKKSALADNKLCRNEDCDK